MGIYIETPMPKRKAEQIVNIYHGTTILAHQPEKFNVPKDKMLICVVNNGMFDAAALVYNEREYKGFTLPSDRDPRPKTWLLMDRSTALKAAGKTEKELY